MADNIRMKWKGNIAFETEMDGHKLITDGGTDVGGENLGVRPKNLC